MWQFPISQVTKYVIEFHWNGSVGGGGSLESVHFFNGAAIAHDIHRV